MKNILVALELKAEIGPVLEHAAALGAAFQASLWLLHVAAPPPDFVGYEPGPQYIRDIRAGTLKEEHARLHQLAADLAGRGLDAHPVMALGATVETILKEAELRRADLIVVGTHGRRGLAKAFLGSTSDDVLHANQFPVLVIPTPAKP